MDVIFLVILVVLSGILPQRFRGRGVIAFYTLVFPLGIAMLFAMVQCSPSPACSFSQGVECLLALSAMCLCVTLPISLLVMKKSLRRLLVVGCGMWFVLGIIAGIYFLCGLLGYHGSYPFSQLGLQVLECVAGFSFTHYELVVGVVLALLAIWGTAMRLGPIIPCAILGMITAKGFLEVFVGSSCVAYESQVAQTRAIQEDIATLILGVICGTVLGLFLDGKRATAQQHTEPDGE